MNNSGQNSAARLKSATVSLPLPAFAQCEVVRNHVAPLPGGVRRLASALSGRTERYEIRCTDDTPEYWATESSNRIRPEFVTRIPGNSCRQLSAWRLCWLLNCNTGTAPKSETLLKRTRHIGKYIVRTASDEANCADYADENNRWHHRIIGYILQAIVAYGLGEDALTLLLNCESLRLIRSSSG
jgi:hypothetical protein